MHILRMNFSFLLSTVLYLWAEVADSAAILSSYGRPFSVAQACSHCLHPMHLVASYKSPLLMSVSSAVAKDAPAVTGWLRPDRPFDSAGYAPQVESYLGSLTALLVAPMGDDAVGALTPDRPKPVDPERLTANE